MKMAGQQPDQILGAFWRAWMGGSGLERLGRQGGKEGGRGWDPGGEGKASGRVVGTDGDEAKLGVSLRWEQVWGDVEV